MTTTAIKGSTSVRSIGYEARTKTLIVEFLGGGAYAYHGVSPETQAALLQAPSVGKFVAGHVKGKYESTKVSRP